MTNSVLLPKSHRTALSIEPVQKVAGLVTHYRRCFKRHTVGLLTTHLLNGPSLLLSVGMMNAHGLPEIAILGLGDNDWATSLLIRHALANGTKSPLQLPAMIGGTITFTPSPTDAYLDLGHVNKFYGGPVLVKQYRWACPSRNFLGMPQSGQIQL